MSVQSSVRTGRSGKGSSRSGVHACSAAEASTLLKHQEPSGGATCDGMVPARQNEAPTAAGSRLLKPRILIPLVVVVAFAILSVGWEVAERRLLPSVSIGSHHALLTIRAGVTTAVASLLVWGLMRRQQRGLASTAGQITDLLESYAANRSRAERFHNPNLRHCRDVLRCQRDDCVMYREPAQRCWQVMALRHDHGNHGGPEVTIQQCHECKVYQQACPDKLTELGESFNNLIFLLEQEGEQVGRMRNQMVEKEKMVATGQLAAGIAHEVCNPLSSISSIVQMLKRTRSTKPNKEQLNLIETHIQRISGTVRQLATLARPSVHRWERVDIGEVLEDAVRLVRFDRRARDVLASVECTKGIPKTYTLVGQLQQVLINLSLNALDAMPDGGKLTISAQKRPGTIVILVSDTGSGIDPSIGRRVFEPFFTTKEPGQGTGLGLAVSYSIIQKHGGSLDFTSTPGQGTTFRVELPILRAVPEA